MNRKAPVGLQSDRGRIARQCVCCGSRDLVKSPAVLMPFVAHRVFDWKPTTIDKTWDLRTIPAGNAVSICNSVLCNSCNHLFLDIRFSEDELALLYADYRGENYVALRSQYEPDYAERNNSLKDGITYHEDVRNFLDPYLHVPVAVLDSGGDTGINTPYREEASICHIYDISAVKVVNGAKQVTQEEALNNRYDLVVCSNVLEHVPYPTDTLSEIYRFMSKKTVLYIELPYEQIMRETQDLSNVLNKKRHWHEHINFFSKSSIERLIDRCGYRVIDFRELSVSHEITLLQLLCSLK